MHQVVMMLFEGRLILPEEKIPNIRRVLDCGTGTASWAVDVARQYPRCEVREAFRLPDNSHASAQRPVLYPRHVGRMRSSNVLQLDILASTRLRRGGGGMAVCLHTKSNLHCRRNARRLSSWLKQACAAVAQPQVLTCSYPPRFRQSTSVHS